MSFNSSLLGGCPAPFYNTAAFPQSGGYHEGRACLPTSQTKGVTCCLPCPVTQWAFPDSFLTLVTASQWINVISLICLLALLLSYAVLPSNYTGSHYLNTCLIIAAIAIDISFIVPQAANSEDCLNPVTPHDMYSSTSCAFSGAFVVFGALSAVTWVFIRTLSMHLQICWDIAPGRRFFYIAQVGGWMFPAIIFTATTVVTGYSFRFGPGVCHINHDHSVEDYWVWLLLLSGGSICLQLGTMIYCFRIYLQNLWAGEDDANADERSIGDVSVAPTGSQGNTGAAAIWNRLRRVILMHWRGLFFITIMLINVVFYASIFLYLDSATTADNPENYDRAAPWFRCLIANPNHPEKCFDAGQKVLVSAHTIGAVIILIGLSGIFLTALFFRWSIFLGWRDLFSNIFNRKAKFDPLTSRQIRGHGAFSWDSGMGKHKDPNFEMQEPPKEHGVAVEGSTVSSVTPHDTFNPALQYGYANQVHNMNMPGQYFAANGMQMHDPSYMPVAHIDGQTLYPQHFAIPPGYPPPPPGYVYAPDMYITAAAGQAMPMPYTGQPPPSLPSQLSQSIAQHQPQPQLQTIYDPNQNMFIQQPISLPHSTQHHYAAQSPPPQHSQHHGLEASSHDPTRPQTSQQYLPTQPSGPADQTHVHTHDLADDHATSAYMQSGVYHHQQGTGPSEMPNPSQTPGLAMRYDDSLPGHAVFR